MRKAILSGFLVITGCTAERPLRADHVQRAPATETATRAQISAVVRNHDNQATLKSCYERALKTAGQAANGRVDVTVVVGPSGAVERVILKAPPRLNPIGPCIQGAITRWAFPANSEQYAANFPLVLQSR
jgi:hypothetical protein